MAEKRNIIIDCDPGIDDALALMLALNSESIDIKAVTAVFGNVDLDRSLDNILKVLSLCKVKNIPLIGKGAEFSLSAEPYKPRFVHGIDGLGNANLERPKIDFKVESAEDIIKCALKENEIDILVTLGPLTNIARLLIEEPMIKESIKEMVVMGGSVFTSGNATEEAEFNFYQDAEAAKVVLNSKIPIRLVSLDATRQILYTRQILKRIKDKKDSKLSSFIHQMFEFALDYYKKYVKRDGIYLPDVLAMCSILDDEVGYFKDLSLDVDIEKERGKVFDNLQAANNIKFCEKVNIEKAVDVFIEGINRLIG